MPPARDPCTWPYAVTPARDFTLWPLHVALVQFSLRSWVDWTPLHDFAKSTTSSKRQRSVLSASNVSRNFFHSRWASPLINLVCLLLGWPFHNSKSSKPNGSASLFGRRNRWTLATFELSSELPIPRLQWPELVVAVALVRTLLLPAKISPLELLPLRAVALPHLLLLSFQTPIMSYSNNSWKPT